MPRKSIIDSIQNGEAAANSPVRRSSRNNQGGTTNAETEKNNDSGIPTRTLRPRRASTQSVDDKEDIKLEEKSAPAKRGRKSSVTSESSEVSETSKPKAVRGRRTSKTEETETAVAGPVKEEPKPVSRVTNRRRTSFTDNLTQETASPVRRTTRGRRASNSDDVIEEAPKTDAKKEDSQLVTKVEGAATPGLRRSRRLSTEATVTPKPAAKIIKTSMNIQDSAINSTDTESLTKLEDDSEINNEADTAAPVVLKEMSVKIASLKKRKILDNVEIDFNLSVIDESADHLENSQTGITQESDDKKETNTSTNLSADSKNNSLNLGDGNNETRDRSNTSQQEVQVNTPRKSRVNITPTSSPRRSPRLEIRLSRNQSPQSTLIIDYSSPKGSAHVETVALNSSTGSIDNSKEGLQDIGKQKSEVLPKASLGRASNVFKPDQREYGFQEPMEISITEIAETASLDISSMVLNKTESNTPSTTSNELQEDLLNKENSNVSVQESDSQLETNDKEVVKISIEPSTPSRNKSSETHLNDNEPETKNPTVRILSALKRKSSSPIHAKSKKSKSPVATEIPKIQQEPYAPQSAQSQSKNISSIIDKRASSTSPTIENVPKDTKIKELQISEEAVEDKAKIVTPVKTVEATLSVDLKETTLDPLPEGNENSISPKKTEDKTENDNTKVDGDEPITTSAPASPKDASVDFEFNLPSDNDDDFLNSKGDVEIASATMNESIDKTTNEKSFQTSQNESVSQDIQIVSVESEEDNEAKAKNKNEAGSDTQSVKTDNTFSELSLVNNYGESTRDDKSVYESSIGENATPEADESKQNDPHVIVDLPDQVESRSDKEAIADMHKEIVYKYLEQQAKSTLDRIENRSGTESKNDTIDSIDIDEESKNDTKNDSTEGALEASDKSENRSIETQTQSHDNIKTNNSKCNASVVEPVAKEEMVKSSSASPEKKGEKTEKPKPRRIKPTAKESSMSDAESVDDEEDVSEEEYNQFVDDMAEEGEEDTPSEDSNQIPDEGESVGSSNLSARDTSDDYDLNDSFICNDEPSVQDLTGSELDSEDEPPKQSRLIDLSSINTDDEDNTIIRIPKKQKLVKPNLSRIINIIDSSSDESQEVNSKNSSKEKVNDPEGAITIESIDVEEAAPNKSNNEQTLNNSKTADATHSIKDDTQNEIGDVKDDTKCCESVQAKNDLEVEVISLDCEETHSDIKEVILKSPEHVEVGPSKVQSQVESSPRYRKSSLSVHENIIISASKESNLTKRINSLVDSFCSTVTAGEISMNLSLEFADRSLEEQAKSPEKEPSTSEFITVLSNIKISPTAVTIEDHEVERVTEPNIEKQIENLDAQESVTKKKKLKKQLSKNVTDKEEEPKEKRKRKKGKKVITEVVNEPSKETSPTKVLKKSVNTEEVLIEENITKNKGMKRRLSKSLTEISDEPKENKKPKKEKKSVSEENLTSPVIEAPKTKNKTKKLSADKKQKLDKRPEKVIELRPDRTQLPMESFNLMEQLLANHRPRHVIRPTRSSINDPAWTSSKAVNEKPSVSQAVGVKKAEKLHPKDFKNIMLSDNNRVKRIDTKTLLRKKGAF